MIEHKVDNSRYVIVAFIVSIAGILALASVLMYLQPGPEIAASFEHIKSELCMFGLALACLLLVFSLSWYSEKNKVLRIFPPHGDNSTVRISSCKVGHHRLSLTLEITTPKGRIDSGRDTNVVLLTFDLPDKVYCLRPIWVETVQRGWVLFESNEQGKLLNNGMYYQTVD